MTSDESSATDRADRAQRALSAVIEDPALKLAFVDAFGEGDALAALRAAASPPAALTSDETNRLRRLAFGRTVTPADEAMAIEARRTLARLDAAAPVAESAALHRAINAVLDAPTPAFAPSGQHADLEPSAQMDWRHRLHPAAIPVGIAFVAGAVLAGLTFAGIRADEPPPAAPRSDIVETGSESPATEPEGGGPPVPLSGQADLEEALKWFDREQAATDVLPGEVEVGGQSVDPASSRLIHASSTSNVFVARSVEGGLCLLLLDAAGGTGTACRLPQQFQMTGLHVVASGVRASTHVFWDGRIASLALRSS